MSNESKNIRDAEGLNVKQGTYGLSLCTTKAFSEGETLLGETRSQIFVQDFPTVDDFEDALSSNGGADTSFLLQHSVPSVSGLVVKMGVSSPLSYLNHSTTPNVTVPYCYTDIDRENRSPQDVFAIQAMRDIEAGEFVTINYNLCGAYDMRKDAPMLRFLELCAEHREEKRPSQFQ